MGTKDISSFGQMLKFWRKVFSISQEHLALNANSSTRHISCLENDKAKPSQEMVEKLCEALNLGVRDSSYLLLAAGFQPEIAPFDFHAKENRWLKNAMTMSLRAADPYPTCLLDRYGDILLVNKAWVELFTSSLPESKVDELSNYYDLLFYQQSLLPETELRSNTLALILMAFHQEAILNNDDHFQVLLARLAQYKNVPKNWQKIAAEWEPKTSFKLEMDVNYETHTFYSVSQTVGAMGPSSFISEPRLVINTLFPEQQALTERWRESALQHQLLIEAA